MAKIDRKYITSNIKSNNAKEINAEMLRDILLHLYDNLGVKIENYDSGLHTITINGTTYKLTPVEGGTKQKTLDVEERSNNDIIVDDSTINDAINEGNDGDDKNIDKSKNPEIKVDQAKKASEDPNGKKEPSTKEGDPDPEPEFEPIYFTNVTWDELNNDTIISFAESISDYIDREEYEITLTVYDEDNNPYEFVLNVISND